MAVPFTLQGSLILPPDTGQPNTTIPFALASAFDGDCSYVLNLLGSATKVIDFGSLAAPGLKGFLLEVDPSSTAAPINVRVNGGAALGQWEVSPGGFLAYGSPSPVTGITSMDIVYTTNVTVRLWLLG